MKKKQSSFIVAPKEFTGKVRGEVMLPGTQRAGWPQSAREE